MVRIALMLAFALVAALAPARADDAGSASLKLVATLGAGGAPLEAGVKWRIFRAGAEPDGSRPLVVETPLPRPMATLPPGDYVIHVAFGLASAMASITLSNGDARVLTVPIAAGALRIGATRNNLSLDPNNVTLAIYVPERHNAQANLVYSKARAGEIIGVPEGAYHIVSTYLDTVGVGTLGAAKAANGVAAPSPSNSVASADVRVETGKIVDVTMRHRFATVTIKLVNKTGGEALANTTFTVLTPGGDIIRDLIGAFPSLVLAEGDYIVVARHETKTYQAIFPVKSGLDRDVEIIAKESTAEGQ